MLRGKKCWRSDLTHFQTTLKGIKPMPKTNKKSSKADPNDVYLWPKKSTMHLYDECGVLIIASKNRYFDLSDCLDLSYERQMAMFGIVLHQKSGSDWTKAETEHAENLIRYKFVFEGCRVEIEELPDEFNDEEDEKKWQLIYWLDDAYFDEQEEEE